MGNSSKRLANNDKTRVSTAKCWKCFTAYPSITGMIWMKSLQNSIITAFSEHTCQFIPHLLINDVRSLSESSSCLWLGPEAQLLSNQIPWNLMSMETINKVFMTFEFSLPHRSPSQNIQGACCPQHLWVTLSCHFPNLEFSYSVKWELCFLVTLWCLSLNGMAFNGENHEGFEGFPI